MDQPQLPAAPSVYSFEDIMSPSFRIQAGTFESRETRRLLMQTFERLDGTSEHWLSRPEERWPQIAEFRRDSLILTPVYSNPHAKRYLKPMHGSLRTVLVEHDREFELPEDEEEALHQLDLRLGSKVFKVHSYGMACLSDELLEAWHMIGHYAPRLIVSKDSSPRIDERAGEIVVSEADLNTLRKALNRNEVRLRNRVRELKRGVVFQSLVARLFPDRITFLDAEATTSASQPTTVPNREKRTPTRIEREIGRASVSALRENLAIVAADSSDSLVQLRSEIERVTLAEMIGRFDALLSEDHQESRWQTFFEENRFVLTLVFARPVRLLHTQFRAQPSSIDGSGAQIGDFLLRELGQGLVIVEIKRPSTDLLSARPYRGTDVFGPSTELGGSISQILHQQARLRTNWLAHQGNSTTLRDSMPDAVKCVVIVGRLPIERAQLRSFDILRTSYKDVEIITFDELGDKLRLILELLNSGDQLEALLSTNEASAVAVSGGSDEGAFSDSPSDSE